ncbi:hypothetical protein FDA94_00490 [Herbidospora galbida]|uniref:Uncharacterized protein n=1 Tax=Herbidospora galbida TaxID=2575442 RepID=A0A4U3MRA6_9ACTN|nr:hypothetical protein [Herbidospora galbida]TKK91324.1 hypothetical protein FDA94_00490 [Herbidospora galbida]
MDDGDVVAGIRAALSVDAFAVDVVAVEARKAADARGAGLTALVWRLHRRAEALLSDIKRPGVICQTAYRATMVRTASSTT